MGDSKIFQSFFHSLLGLFITWKCINQNDFWSHTATKKQIVRWFGCRILQLANVVVNDCCVEMLPSLVHIFNNWYILQMWCDHAKWVWTRKTETSRFQFDCIHECESYTLMKTPSKLNVRFRDTAILVHQRVMLGASVSRYTWPRIKLLVSWTNPDSTTNNKKLVDNNKKTCG